MPHRSMGFTRMPSDQLGRIHWKGEGSYRCLSHTFTVRWNRARFGRYVRHVLDPFTVSPQIAKARKPATPGLPPSYSLVDLGPEQERQFVLLYGEDILLESGRADDVLHYLLWHVNAEAFWETGEFLVVHAGAVITPAGYGVLLPGEAGSGKTTLTAGLVRAGFGYLSDEVGAIDPVTGRLYPYPKTMDLKGDAFKLFPELRARNGKLPVVQSRWRIRADDIRPGAIGGPCSLRFVIAPRYREGASTEISPISRADAVTDLWESVWNLFRYGDRALYLLARVIRGARCYRMVFGDLLEAVEAVETVTRARRAHA
jgi:hypothetical protein